MKCAHSISLQEPGVVASPREMRYSEPMKSEKTRIAMSESAKARCTPEWRASKSAAYRTIINDDRLRQLYECGLTQVECAAALGVGRKVIANAMRRLKIVPRKAAKRDQWGEKNHLWKGDAASKGPLHRRLYRVFGQPQKCDVCGTCAPQKSFDWANLTGDYANPQDYKRMCRSCHWRYDEKHRNFKGAKGGKGKRGTRVLAL